MALPGVVQAQAPRYQSPISMPATPQQQLSLPSPQPITPNGSVVEDVIVRVNDQIINRSDLERSQQQMAAENQQNNASPAETAERQRNLLRDMIDQQLLLSRAKELGLNADAEVIRRLDEIRKQNHMDSMEDLEKAARQQGVSFEDFKANIRNGILTQQVVRDEVGRRLQMTQAQEQAYYDAHKQDFAQPGAGPAQRDSRPFARRGQRHSHRSGAGQGQRHRREAESRGQVQRTRRAVLRRPRRRRRAEISACSSVALSPRFLKTRPSTSRQANSPLPSARVRASSSSR